MPSENCSQMKNAKCQTKRTARVINTAHLSLQSNGEKTARREKKNTRHSAPLNFMNCSFCAFQFNSSENHHGKEGTNTRPEQTTKQCNCRKGIYYVNNDWESATHQIVFKERKIRLNFHTLTIIIYLFGRVYFESRVARISATNMETEQLENDWAICKRHVLQSKWGIKHFIV